MGVLKKHLNIQWFILTALMFTTVLFDSPIPYAVIGTFWLIDTFWVLHCKGRSLAWIIFPISALFLKNMRS